MARRRLWDNSKKISTRGFFRIELSTQIDVQVKTGVKFMISVTSSQTMTEGAI